MAQIVKRKNKNGSASLSVPGVYRVWSERQTGHNVRTFTPPPTLTGRKLEKEVHRRADEFEREVHNDLALVRYLTGWPDKPLVVFGVHRQEVQTQNRGRISVS